MKSQITLPRSLLRAFSLYLLEQGYEVDEMVSTWRVLMYRKSDSQWTQGYYGKTRSGKTFRSFIRFAGPEVSAVTTYLENYDGTLA